MRKRSLNEKMNIEISNIENNKKNNGGYNTEEKGNSIKYIAHKSKSLGKKLIKREEIKQLEVIIEKKYFNFDLDFIYRREKYTLKNIYNNYLI